jgi:hypothetical protein
MERHPCYQQAVPDRDGRSRGILATDRPSLIEAEDGEKSTVPIRDSISVEKIIRLYFVPIRDDMSVEYLRQ